MQLVFQVHSDDLVERRLGHEPDPQIMEMVGNWAAALDASRAERLGFVAETSFDEIIRVHLEDELHR